MWKSYCSVLTLFLAPSIIFLKPGGLNSVMGYARLRPSVKKIIEEAKYISTNRPWRQSCPTLGGSQSATSIYGNTPLWLAAAESGTRLTSRLISIDILKILTSGFVPENQYFSEIMDAINWILRLRKICQLMAGASIYGSGYSSSFFAGSEELG